ncbi:hypothetical protein V9T40_007009 [Parthenolecanium corni]|uniref:Uncharacterized protein n=1 Tax=Parthenolecanium corni TaxID=536013 RepID=A0AAN9YAD5_9HEMI
MTGRYRHPDGRFRREDETPRYRDGRKHIQYDDEESEDERTPIPNPPVRAFIDCYTGHKDHRGATCSHYHEPPLYGLSPKEKRELFTVDIEKSREIVEKYKKKQIEIPEAIEVEDMDALDKDTLKQKLKESIDRQKEYQNILSEYLTDEQSGRENDMKKMDEINRKLKMYELQVKSETPTHPRYYSESMNHYREDLPRGAKPPVRDSLESFSGNPKIAASTTLLKHEEMENTETEGGKGDKSDQDKQTGDARCEVPERGNSRSKHYSPPSKWREAEERRDQRRKEYSRRSGDRNDNRDCYCDERNCYWDERDRDCEPDRRPSGRDGYRVRRNLDPEDNRQPPDHRDGYRSRRDSRNDDNDRSRRQYDDDWDRSRRNMDDSRHSRRNQHSSDDNYEPDKEELWNDYINDEESNSSKLDREYSRRSRRLN